MEIEFQDLPSEDEIFTPPPIFLPGDDDRSHDDVDHHQPPHLPPPGDAPGGAPGGQRKSGRPRKEPLMRSHGAGRAKHNTKNTR